MSTRLKGLEAVFGGLDRIYVLHKWAGIAAMIAVLLHDTIDAEMRGLTGNKLLNDIAETLGEISLYGLLILIVVSIATFIPYHLWKWRHKAMGAMFAAGVFHFFFIMKPFSMTDPAGLYTGVFCIIGIAAYIWMLLPDTMHLSRAYKISDVTTTGDATAITMMPTGKAVKTRPGQFGILRFVGANKPEPHPFSFSQIGTDGSLRVTVKALGDFTAALPHVVSVGQAVHIQGPFGRFENKGKKAQIWIAGGIGITPFMAWADALKDDAMPADLFYCVKSRETAPHLDELVRVAKQKANLTLHVIASDEGQRLSADMIASQFSGDISKMRISFCGPVSLRDALQKGLQKYGVSPRNFHFEEFEFRTGIGFRAIVEKLKKLSNNKTWGCTRLATSIRLIYED
ncbi:MAG: ferredoxin reductase family protein, partial [Planktomarina sp.]